MERLEDILRVVCWAALGLSLLGCVDEETAPSLALLERGAVYGEDDRVEVHEHPDEALRSIAMRSSVALISSRFLERTPAGQVSIDAVSLGSAYGLCETQRFITQPTAASCSGVLIDDDLVLTAGHCVETLMECRGKYFVFGYWYDDTSTLQVATRGDVFTCAQVVVSSFNQRMDWAVIQLDRPATPEFSPVTIEPTRAPVEVGESIALVGCGSGLPLKLDSGGRVISSDSTTLDFFKATTDSFGGHSGGGVYNSARRLVGILDSGAEDYHSIGPCSVATEYPADGTEGGEAVTYAWSAIAELCETGWPSERLCGVQGACGDGFCVGDEVSGLCPDDCAEDRSPPWEWTCDPAFYGTSDDCDCECGAYDPDCVDLKLRVVGCEGGAFCDAEGLCTLDPDPPEAWTCGRERFADGQRCDCECGAYDLDCLVTTTPIQGCEQGLICDLEGLCVESVSEAPDGWSCSPEYYNAADDCDCGCGAYDPDCDDPALRIVGCAVGEVCGGPSGVCERAEGLPEAWSCNANYYDANDDCDCACGAYDPDCDDPGLAVVNCAASQTCGASGLCVDSGTADPDDCGCRSLRRASTRGTPTRGWMWLLILFGIGSRWLAARRWWHVN